MKRVSIIAALLLIFATASEAEVTQVGPNEFIAGIPTAQIQYFAAQQRMPNWCWAASIQMVLNFHGLAVSQQDVVTRIFGAPVNAPGNPRQILAALSGWAPSVAGGFRHIRAVPYARQGSDLVNDLARRWPIIVGLKNPHGGVGHAYVLTAVKYSVGPNNQPIFRSVILRDPWPSSPSRQEMSWMEFASRADFMARVFVQR